MLLKTVAYFVTSFDPTPKLIFKSEKKTYELLNCSFLEGLYFEGSS